MIDHLCKAVMTNLRTTCFVETGLYMGETVAEVSVWFAEMYPNFGVVTHLVHYGLKSQNPWNSFIPYPVFRAVDIGVNYFWSPASQIYSIDQSLPFVENVRGIFASNPNINIIHGSSEQELAKLVSSEKLRADQNPFIYLDAHWDDYWPLRDELEVILKLDKAVVVVDDFQVPGRPEWGFDMYQGKPCGLATISDLILRHPPVAVFFPVRSNRDNRGWVMIFKGYSEQELRFMSGLPFVRVTGT